MFKFKTTTKAVDEITKEYIRNTSYVYTISGNIFPENMKRYDMFTLREPINNAIGHQDYGMSTRIELLEYEDEKLVIQNYGRFIPRSVEDVVENDCPDSRYRNPFLMEAMCNVGMADTEGGGIKKLFVQQKRRFFLCPHTLLPTRKSYAKYKGKYWTRTSPEYLLTTRSCHFRKSYCWTRCRRKNMQT